MSSESHADLSPHAPARTRLLLAGASLVALGVALNLGRFSGPDEPLVREELVREELVREELVREETVAHEQHTESRHKGEEGKMGRPILKSGLFAMKGPKEEDVWGAFSGTEVGESYGVGGLGLVGTGRGGGGVGMGSTNVGLGGAHAFELATDEPPRASHSGPATGLGFITVASDPLSTFSIDVDTASYSAMRRSVRSGALPAAEMVRIEELINYFDYDYVPPAGDVPFSVTAEVGQCPWDQDHQLVHVGLQGKVIAPEDLPPRNLVFLIDVSGSMDQEDKLPLVKRSLAQLTETLRAEDSISLVVYAGAAGVVLPPTSGADKDIVYEALGRLQAGGSTNGGAGIELAYAQARAAAKKDGVNRVILASDGDFNVGVSSHEALVRLIEKQRRSGVELSVLGYGMGHRDGTMEQLADRGNGNYAYIDGPEEATKVLVEQAGGTLVTIAKDVKIQVRLDPTRVKSYRLVGYDNRRLEHHEFADDTKDAGEIGAGHSVTALYEVVPREGADTDAPWMALSVRYKQPKGTKSALLKVPVVGAAQALDSTSDDFRFSAAVAAFGMLLRGAELEETATFAEVQRLAIEAIGEDPSCRRHQLVALVGEAARLGSDQAAGVLEVPACEPRGSEVKAPPPSEAPELVSDPVSDPGVVDAEAAASPESSSRRDVGAWVLEVLRLLPPFLALPLFVMALRRPRRQR